MEKQQLIPQGISNFTKSGLIVDTTANPPSDSAQDCIDFISGKYQYI